MPSKDEFRAALRNILWEAERKGARVIDVNARGLHRKIADYPSPDHRMPACCEAMHEERRAGDLALSVPPEGFGASLTIRYHLPR